MFLDNVSSDEEDIVDNDYKPPNIFFESPKNLPIKYSSYNSKARFKPRFYNESYKLKCSRIPCKFHPNCKFQLVRKGLVSLCISDIQILFNL